ncbi:hypothetical protein ACWD3I_48690 [Streptomyces sp. NPDC002817]|uniref:hypothetical protein n=1 Tax=Streptomyces sp. NPDC088357 TaxID=3154655 RepID=UPI003433C702
MSEKPAVTADGYCTNTKPVPGTTGQVNGHALGGKFVKMHGRRPSLTDRGNLRRHKPPKA